MPSICPSVSHRPIPETYQKAESVQAKMLNGQIDLLKLAVNGVIAVKTLV